MPIWFRKNGGQWNNSPTANPATNTGGITMSQINQTLFPTVIADGDCSVTCNFGNSAFQTSGPVGFTPGWPNAALNGWTTLDLTKGGPLSNGNLTLNSTSFFVASQATNGFSQGSFYFEIQLSGRDFFGTTTGGGVGRAYPGLDYSFYTSGRYGPLDNGGGTLWNMGGIGGGFQVDIFSNGNAPITNIFPISPGDWVGIAVKLESLIFTGVSANAQVGNISGSIQNGNPLTMSEFVSTEYIQPPDDRDITLLYSDDGGATWNDGIIQTVGQQGQFLTNIQYQRLGEARNRIFKIRTGYSGALTGIFVSYLISRT